MLRGDTAQVWADDLAVDGDESPWLEAPLGSVYNRQEAGNVVSYLKTADNGADADWSASTTSTTNSVTTAMLADGSVTYVKLAADARGAENVIADPGTGAAIPVTANGTIAIAIADASETNTLARPAWVGQELTLACTTRAGSGSRAITVAAAVNQTGNTIITLDAAGEAIALRGIEIGANLAWRILYNDAAGLSGP
jgi:hypothetical protein